MTRLVTLTVSVLPSEIDSAQRRSYITYTLPSPMLGGTFYRESTSSEKVEGTGDGKKSETEREQAYIAAERSITLLESHSIISVAGNTGQRTWEAALHLAAFLVSEEINDTEVSNSMTAVGEYVWGKHILELGAGTGLVSILCVKYLGARLAVATDGDEGIVDALKTNILLNGLDEVDEIGMKNNAINGQGNSNNATRKIQASVMRWGHSLIGTSLGELFDDDPPDTVIAADVVSI